MSLAVVYRRSEGAKAGPKFAWTMPGTIIHADEKVIHINLNEVINTKLLNITGSENL